MKIIYLAPETGIRYNMSGGAGTHMRGTVESLKENNDVIVEPCIKIKKKIISLD